MSGYRADRQWSDRFIPQIKSIVGPLLLDAAPFELDAKEATDLMVFRARDMRIAARIRRHGFFDNYGNEFTIRARRDSGAETELSKIVNGWGDWLFYGHADERASQITQWMLIDLDHFRAGLIRSSMNGHVLRTGDKPNGDGTYFKWFDARSFPKHPKLLVASSFLVSERTAEESVEVSCC